MAAAACPVLACRPNCGDPSHVAMSSIVVLVAGDPVPQARASRGGFFELIQAAAPRFRAASWRAHDLRELDVIPALTDASAVIVSGSPSSVMEGLPWMERAAERLRDLARREVPLLGICFGHQLLGHALGGKVARNPRGREMGTLEQTVWRSDPVFGEPGTQHMNTTHLDSVVELPPGAEVLASSALEPHSALRFGPSAWGVQFHPEIDGEVMRHYLEARRPALLAEGFDWAAAERTAADAPGAAAVIERFLDVASSSARARS